MQFIAIVLLTLAVAITYGVVHDQITVRVCLEYFTFTHPPLLGTSSPTLIALGWGVFSTWTAGIPAGFVLASVSRNGRRYPQLGVGTLLPMLGWLAGAMAIFAFVSGLVGYVLTNSGLLSVPADYALAVPAETRSRFMAVWWTHTGSYLAGFVGLAAVSVLLYKKRLAMGPIDRISIRTTT